MFTRRKQDMAVPEVGAEAPEFNLPSAQGGQLRLSMRTAHGPVVVVFFRGAWSEEDVAYFKALSEKEDEINHARASVVGIGAIEPDEAQEFVRASGIKSYVLYDYVRITTRQWGLMEKNKEHGNYARPAVFIVGSDTRCSTPGPTDVLRRRRSWRRSARSPACPNPPSRKKRKRRAPQRMARNRRRCPPRSGSA